MAFVCLVRHNRSVVLLTRSLARSLDLTHPHITQSSRRFRCVILFTPLFSFSPPLSRHHHRSPRLLHHHPRHALPTGTSQLPLRLRTHRLASLCIRAFVIPSPLSRSHRFFQSVGLVLCTLTSSPLHSLLTSGQPQYPSLSWQKRAPLGALPSSWVFSLSSPLKSSSWKLPTTQSWPSHVSSRVSALPLFGLLAWPSCNSSLTPLYVSLFSPSY